MDYKDTNTNRRSLDLLELSATHTLQQEGVLSFWSGCIYCFQIVLRRAPVYCLMFFDSSGTAEFDLKTINAKDAMSCFFLYCNEAFFVYFKIL